MVKRFLASCKKAYRESLLDEADRLRERLGELRRLLGFSCAGIVLWNSQDDFPHHPDAILLVTDGFGGAWVEVHDPKLCYLNSRKRYRRFDSEEEARSFALMLLQDGPSEEQRRRYYSSSNPFQLIWDEETADGE